MYLFFLLNRTGLRRDSRVLFVLYRTELLASPQSMFHILLNHKKSLFFALFCL